MRMPNWLIVLPTICFGFIILTSLVIFVLVRLGRRVISGINKVGSTLDDGPSQDLSTDARWSQADLASQQPEKSSQTMRACPACGGESPDSTPVCDFCGRPF